MLLVNRINCHFRYIAVHGLQGCVRIPGIGWFSHYSRWRFHRRRRPCGCGMGNDGKSPACCRGGVHGQLDCIKGSL